MSLVVPLVVPVVVGDRGADVGDVVVVGVVVVVAARAGVVASSPDVSHAATASRRAVTATLFGIDRTGRT